MTQNTENAIRNGIKYLQLCLSTLLPSPCSSDLMILVNILSDVAAFLQHMQTHSNVFYFPVLWNRQFTLPGNFLFSAFWEPLHYNLSPLPLPHPQGLPKLAGIHSIQGTLMSSHLPSRPWWWRRRTSRHPFGNCHPLGFQEQATSPCLLRNPVLSLRTYRGVRLWSPRGVPRASELIFCVGPDELEEGQHSQFQVLIWTPGCRISAVFAWCSGPATANLYSSHKNRECCAFPAITVPVLLFFSLGARGDCKTLKKCRFLGCLWTHHSVPQDPGVLLGTQVSE